MLSRVSVPAAAVISEAPRIEAGESRRRKMEFKSKCSRAIKADATSAPVLRSRGIQSALLSSDGYPNCLHVKRIPVSRLLGPSSTAVCVDGTPRLLSSQRRSLFLWCNLVVYFNSTNFSKKLQNTRMERTQDSQFFLLFLLFVYIVSSHGDYSYIQ